MSSWLDKLRAGRVLVIDGATGTELRRRGAPWGDSTWSALAGHARQDLLFAIHCDYIAAGAEIITTNTFGATRFVLEAAGHGTQFDAINRAALAAAKEAKKRSGGDVAIAGAISCLPPRFDAAAYPEPAQERAAYGELAELFAAEGADLIALEMLQDTRHAALACEAARACGVPFWLGVSCRLGADKNTLVAFDYPETRLEQVLDALLPYGPTVVNLMHSPPSAIPSALELLRERWQGFIGVYPEIRSEGSNEAHAPAALAALADGWIEQGARVVGGCCGTSPEHIRALKALLAERPTGPEARLA
jgi:S-methylmethionine-dependent homocysteine/selenocysteine methylase